MQTNKNKSVFARVPAFPFRKPDNSLLTVSELVDQSPNILGLISIASITLKRALENNRSSPKLNEKLNLYVLRAAQRCVPFGAFTQLSVIKDGAREHNDLQVSLAISASAGQIKAGRQTVSNNALFRVNPTLRFLPDGSYIFKINSRGTFSNRRGSRHRDFLNQFLNTPSFGSAEAQKLFPGITNSDLEHLYDIQALIQILPDDTHIASSVLNKLTEVQGHDLDQLADANGALPNVNSYSSSQPFNIGTEAIGYAIQKTSEVARRLSRPNPLFTDFIKFFQRVFNEGPVSLDILAHSLSDDWRAFAGQDESKHEQDDGNQLRIIEAVLSRRRDESILDLEEIFKEAEASQISPQGSALVTIADCEIGGKCSINLHHILAGTGLEYMGRFFGEWTDIDREMEAIATAYESSVSEEVVELWYRPTDSVYNISNRRQIFKRRLNLFDAFPIRTGQEYRMSDIEIFLESGLPRFRHKKSGRRIRLVLPNAVNYTLPNHMQIFRVLAACCRPALYSLNLGDALETATYLPRLVCSENVWIRPRSWRLRPSEVDEIRRLSPDRRGSALQQWVKTNIGEKEFEIVNFDRRLIFSAEDSSGLNLACNILTRQDCWISESFSANKILPAMHGENRYNHELVIPLVGNGQQTPKLQKEVLQSTKSVTSYLDPTWVYYEIYCSRAKIEDLLVSVLASAVAHLHETGLAEKWFFIRYSDRGPHLRIRLKARDYKSKSALNEEIERRLYVLLSECDIVDWSSKNYLPELIRYRNIGIDKVHDIFHRDSENCLSYLRQVKGFSAAARYEEDILYFGKAALGYFDLFGVSQERRREIADILARGAGRMQSHTVQKSVEQKLFLIARNTDHETGEIRSLDELSRLGDTEQLEAIDSLVHMSANRSFASWSRAQEKMAWKAVSHVYARLNKCTTSGAIYDSSAVEQ